MRKIIMLALAVAAGVMPGLALVPSTGKIEYGKWNSRFAEGKALAEAENRPMVLFWASPGCGLCEKMKRACDASTTLPAWAEKRELIMIFSSGAEDAKRFAKYAGPETISKFPFMAVYWPKADGSQVLRGFVGRSGMFPVNAKTLDQSLMDTVDMLTAGWDPAPPYRGAKFAVDRLEAEIGLTEFVNVPLTREETAGGVLNRLVPNAEGTKPVEFVWEEGETEKTVTVPVDMLKKDAAVTIEDEAGAVKDQLLTIAVVPPQPVSVTNPLWLGERDASSLGWGEWTMDIDVAKRKTAAEEGDAFTLVYTSGVLWCPYCKKMDEGLLSTDGFANWAAENKVALVLLDNPKRSASDVKDETGKVIAVGDKNDGAPPTLLRSVADANGVSGASYLSRKMISVEEAEAVLQRNHDLGYGELLAPESLRCGYPTLVLLDKQGNVAGRLRPFRNAEGEYGLDENLARLNALLALAVNGNREADGYLSTTELELAPGDATAEFALQVNQPVKAFRLANAPAGGMVQFECTDKSVKLTLWQVAPEGSRKSVAVGEGALSVSIPAEDGELYLTAEKFSESAEYGEANSIAVSIGSSILLIPQEAKSEFVPNSAEVAITVEAGVTYKFSGLADVDGIWTADETGVKKFAVAAGAAVVGFQIWRPGFVQMLTAETTLFELDGRGEISVVRPEGAGASGEARVSLVFEGLEALKGRIEFAEIPDELVWADGETGVKTIPFTIVQDTVYQPNATFTVTLQAAEGTTLGETVSARCTIVDSDKPMLPEREYGVRFIKNFEQEFRWPVLNVLENKSVKLLKKSGSLPSGVKIKYDSATKEVVIYGKATREASAELTYSVQENRQSGSSEGFATRFKIAVIDPRNLSEDDPDANAFVGAQVRNQTIPLMRGEEEAILAATVAISVSSANKITAKCDGLVSRKMSFSGNWQKFEKGVASALLADRYGNTLAVEMAKDGTISVELLDSATEEILSGELPRSADFDFASLQGVYAVALENLNGEEAEFNAGDATLTLKMSGSTFTRSGKVSYAGLLPNGQKISGSANLIPGFGDTPAMLPILVKKSSYAFTAMLAISAEGVTDAPGSRAFWSFANSRAGIHEAATLSANGRIHDPGAKIGLVVKPDGEGADRIELNALAVAEEPILLGTVTVDSGNKFAVASTSTGLKVKYASATGIITGTANVELGGKKVRASYQAVAMPSEYVCSDCGDDLEPQAPFALGTLYWSERIEGRTVDCSLPVRFEVSH